MRHTKVDKQNAPKLSTEKRLINNKGKTIDKIDVDTKFKYTSLINRLAGNDIIFLNNTIRATKQQEDKMIAIIKIISGNMPNFNAMYDKGKFSICNPPTII